MVDTTITNPDVQQDNPPAPLSSLASQVAAMEAQNATMRAKLALAGIPAGDAVVAGPGIGVPPGPTTATWYRPVPNAADAARLGVPLASLCLFTGQQKVTATPIGSDASDDDVKFYAGYGFRPDGSRSFGSEADYAAAQVLCDRIASLDPSAPPSAADNILKGAGTNDPTVDLVVIMWFAINNAMPRELTIQSCLSIPDALTAYYRKGGPSGN